MSFQDLTQQVVQLYGEGKFAEALELVDRRAASFPEQAGLVTLWRMCLLSLCGRSREALDAFRRGLEQGSWWHESQLEDSDLDAVRELPEFKRLAQRSQEKYLQARAHTKPHRRLLLPEETSKTLPLLIAVLCNIVRKSDRIYF